MSSPSFHCVPVSCISTADAGRRFICLFDYWKALRERRDVESYMAMTRADDRARDSINHEMILRYEMDFASMKAWRDKVVATALDDRTISTPLGRSLQIAKAREDIADIAAAGSTSPLGFQHCFTSIETW